MRSLRLELIVYMSGNLLLLFYLELQQCYWSIDLIVGYLLVRHDSRESSDSNLDSCFWRCWNMHWALCLGTTCYQDSWRGSNSNNTIKVCRKTRYSVTRATLRIDRDNQPFSFINEQDFWNFLESTFCCPSIWCQGKKKLLILSEER